MERKIKLGLCILIFLGICGIFNVSKAAISSSNATVSPGQNVSISVTSNVGLGSYRVTLTSLGGCTLVNSSGGTGAGGSTISNASTTPMTSLATFTIKAPSTPGTYKVSFSGSAMMTPDEASVANSSSTSTITVTNSNSSGGGNNSNSGGNSGGNNSGSGTNTGGQVGDTNVNLSNLGIRPYDFSGFSNSKTSYTVNVPNETTSIEVYAKAKSSNATVSGTGQKTLKEGTNKFTVTVTNGGNSKSFTISVIRATLDGEIIPNLIDEETPEENQDDQVGIGLATLEIPDFELDKSFETGVHEYIVKTDHDLTLEELNEIKNNIVATCNAENVKLDIIANISEDGKRTITIIISDAEKEYSRYVITFENEKKEKSVIGTVVDTSNSGEEDGFDIRKLPIKTRMYIAIAGIGLLLMFAIGFSINSFIKSKKLKIYKNDVMESEKSEFGKIGEYYEEVKDGEDSEMLQENEETEKDSDLETEEESESKSSKLRGYRSLRNQRKNGGGRHF